MKKIFVTVAIGALLVMVLVLAGCTVADNTQAEDSEITVLKMGLIPADDAEEMLRNYEPIKAYLSEELGIPVEIQVTSDYTAAIEAMRMAKSVLVSLCC